MPRLPIALVVCLVCGVGAPTALAQGGSGLYAPFPEPASAEQAQRYVEELGVQARAGQLRRGRFLGASLTGAPATAAASRRAGSGTAAAGWLVVPVLAALAVAAALTVRRPA
jgi:hypothetical protein